MHKRLFAAVLTLGLLISMTGTAVADGDDHPVFPLDTYPPTPNDNAVLQWNEEALECVRATKPGPTVVARSLFVLHSATYNAWAAYDAKAAPTIKSGFTRQAKSQRTLANKTKAVSHAAHVALTDLFTDAGCRAEFDHRLASLGQTKGDASPAATLGRGAGQKVVDVRRNDGANQSGNYADTSGYTPVNTPDTVVDRWRWQPLCVPLSATANAAGETCVGNGGMPQKALTPHWGDVAPFNPAAPKEAQAIQEPKLEYKDTIGDIVHYSATLTDRTKVIAEYWADGPKSELPPGHWNLFAQWVSRRWKQSIDDDAKMFLALDGAMLDASIGAWDAKYKYDIARPVTAIKALGDQQIEAWAGPGLGTQTIAAKDWIPYQPVDFPSPPFPEYISGHSTFSAAGAAMLKDFGAWRGRDGDIFGASVTIEKGTLGVEEGTPSSAVTLSWPSFWDAADEAGVSRRYGGIHWVEGDAYARDLGKKLGEGAFSIAKKLWEGG